MGVDPHALYAELVADLQDACPGIGKIPDGLWPGCSFREAAAVSIHNSFLKKFKSGMNEETKASALQKFLQVNSACGAWELQLENSVDDLLVGEVRKNLSDFWFRFGSEEQGANRWSSLVDHPYDILNRGCLGSGSSIKGTGTDFYSKLFSSRLSCPTASLYFMYRRWIRGFPEWNNAESIRLLNYGEPLLTETNRLDFVPKNDDISRTICVETTLGMFYQRGFGEILADRLREIWGISLEDQQFRNRELARIGSWNGSFSTIDLSSASDSISMKMLDSVLPSEFYSWLVKLRSSSSKVPGRDQPVVLNMISTMGNGYTFPLQTVLFTAIVRAAFSVAGVATSNPRGSYLGNYGVNGDDIIVPSGFVTRLTLRLLQLLGFSVNTAKTFVEGPFRESCGGDFFEGRNLRGVYVKSLSKTQDIYAVINQLNLFSTRTGILLPRTVQMLVKKVKRLFVPCHEADDSGIRVPFSLIRTRVLDPDTQSVVYTAWKVKAGPAIRIEDSCLRLPRSFKLRIFNPSGLHISFLQRSVQSYTISPRNEVVAYRTKRCVTPYWDRVPETHPLAGWCNWRQWNTAVYLNLFK